MARIQILSDLHLESPKAYDIFEITPKAPHLALLGDIGNAATHKDEVLSFLTTQLRQFQTVLFVPGNHEAYGTDWNSALQVLKDFGQEIRERRGWHGEGATQLGEFVLMDRGSFELPTAPPRERVIILGCSLFSHIPSNRETAVEMGLQDFFQTTDWSTRGHNEAHARDLEWLNTRVRDLESSQSRIVILTHWSPTTDARSVDPRHVNSPITAGFSTDLSDQPCTTSPNVVLWAFGHTHYNCDFSLQRQNAAPLRLITNQRGYYFAQAGGFNPERVIGL